MGDVAIRVEHLSKCYRITRSQTRVRYRTLGESLAEALAAPLRRVGRSRASAATYEMVWALKDASFEVEEGEVLGIIGPNGAGKSTLLKILSRITEPTRGRVELYGRVGALLEVGTGFHPELTGRENVYLNGAILGMRRGEIERKFDEIVAFAEVERFLDTPVKRYSSGMFMRLAFAVAAHLEPEILLVDEVLAVGDATFQKKSLGKMGDVAKEGRTVLFVSHNMTALRSLCARAIWLDHGGVVASGAASEVVERYLQHQTAGSVTREEAAALIRGLPGDPTFRLRSIEIRQDQTSVRGAVVNGKPVSIEIRYEVLEEVIGFRVYIDLCDEYGEVIMRSFHDEDADERVAVLPGQYISTARIGEGVLAPRRYTMSVQATIHGVRDCMPGGMKIPMTVVHTGRLNRAYVDEPFVGKLGPILTWETKPDSSGGEWV